MSRSSHRDASILIVPGLGGSGPDHWQSHWQREWPYAKRVIQWDWDHPALRVWIEQLNHAVETNPNSVLVGHSLGCVLIAHFARQHPQPRVRGALLVAPADVDFCENLPVDLASFSPTPLGRFPFPATLVASTNDPFMPFARAAQLAEAWGATLVNLQACGHINVAAGFGPWPAGRILFDEFIDTIEVTRGLADHHRLRRRA